MYVFKDKKVRNDVLRKGGNQMKIIVTPEEMRSNATALKRLILNSVSAACAQL